MTIQHRAYNTLLFDAGSLVTYPGSFPFYFFFSLVLYKLWYGVAIVTMES